MLQGFYVLRNDLSLLALTKNEAGEYPSFVSTVYRSFAFKFNTQAEAEQAIERHNLTRCIVIEFP